MAIGNVIGTGVGVVKGAVDLGKDIFGGGDDEPNPETANNLAQALSYMDRLDDMNKASEIANEMIKRGADGESYETVAAWADRQAGYNDGGPFRGIYPWDLIYKHYTEGVSQLRQARKNNRSQNMGGSSSSQSTSSTSADVSQNKSMMQNVVFGLIGLILVYVATQ